MRLLVLVSLLLISLPQSGHALSCVRFTADMVVDQINRLDKDKIDVMVGDLLLGEKLHSLRSQSVLNIIRDQFSNTINAKVTAKNLKTNESFIGDIKVEQSCIGEWCGYLEQETKNVIFILNKAGSNYVLPLHACGGRVFGEYEDKHIKQIKECLQNDNCASAQEQDS